MTTPASSLAHGGRTTFTNGPDNDLYAVASDEASAQASTLRVNHKSLNDNAHQHRAKLQRSDQAKNRRLLVR